MFRNVLVAVDGSPHADRALTEAIDLVTASNGRLTLLTAVERPTSLAATSLAAGAAPSLADDLDKEAHEALDAAVARVPDAIPVTKILSQQPIRLALMEQVKSGTHDLLVIGSRGRGAFTAQLLGSVSHFALDHSPIPILVVHAERPDARRLAVAEAAGSTTG